MSIWSSTGFVRFLFINVKIDMYVTVPFQKSQNVQNRFTKTPLGSQASMINIIKNTYKLCICLLISEY